MKKTMKAAGGALALLAMTGQCLAASCARPSEALALKTAAMQQELMVAALYCNDVGLYNRFVVSYQHELQDADAALLGFFQHGHGGSAAYHSYKTGLANDFSLSSLHGMQAYCSAANTAFDTALNPEGRGTLAGFLSTQSVRGAESYPVCETSASEEINGGSTRLAANRPN
jgi:hypothetical protein